MEWWSSKRKMESWKEWSAGVVENAKRTLILIKRFNTPTLQYSNLFITPVLQYSMISLLHDFSTPVLHYSITPI